MIEPAFLASKLVFNMLILGAILKYENFSKNVQIATGILVTAVFYLSLAGPTTQNYDTVGESFFFDNLVGLIWLGVVTVMYVVSTGIMFCSMRIRNNSMRQEEGLDESLKHHPQQPRRQSTDIDPPSTSKTTTTSFFTKEERILLLVYIGASTLCSTASKAAILFDGTISVFLIGSSWLMVLIWMYESYLEAFHVRSLAHFIPISLVGSILMNSITGVSFLKFNPNFLPFVALLADRNNSIY